MLADLLPQTRVAAFALKSFAILALAAGAFYAAWSWRTTIAKNEQREAVDSAVLSKVTEIKAVIDQEREDRKRSQEEMDATLAQMSSKLANIQYTGAQVKAGIDAERKANKAFYEQPLPEGGRNLWLKARQAATAPQPPASSSQ